MGVCGFGITSGCAQGLLLGLHSWITSGSSQRKTWDIRIELWWTMCKANAQNAILSLSLHPTQVIELKSFNDVLKDEPNIANDLSISYICIQSLGTVNLYVHNLPVHGLAVISNW